MKLGAAATLAWAPLSDAPPEQIVRLPRYSSVEECVEPQPEGPCAHRECRYHLAHRGYWEHEVAPSRDCSLDVANEGPHTLDEVADALGVSAERVRQLEQQRSSRCGWSPPFASSTTMTSYRSCRWGRRSEASDERSAGDAARRVALQALHH